MEQLNLNSKQLMQKYEQHYPENFQDPCKLEVMKNPVMHVGCGASFEEASIRDWLNKNPTCMLCRAPANVVDFVPNRNLKNGIEELPEKVLRVIDLQGNEINVLRDEKNQNIHQIEDLNIENQDLKLINNQKDGVIVGLRNDNSELTNQKTQAIQEKRAALDEVKNYKERVEYFEQKPVYQDMSRKIIQLTEKIDLMDLKEGSIESFIINSKARKTYNESQWKTRLNDQKQNAEHYLQCIFKGGPSIERRNAFIDIGLSNHFQNHHENIYRTILNHHKGDIVELTENLMRHHSYTISDATSGSYQIRFSEQENKKFFFPLIDKLIEQGNVVARAIDFTRKHNTTLQWKPENEWNDFESNRFSPKTYLGTVKTILKQSLRYEICEQISLAILK